MQAMDHEQTDVVEEEVTTLLQQFKSDKRSSTISQIAGEEMLLASSSKDRENGRTEKSLSSNSQTFANIIKANIGSGILGMPFAFKHSGYILGTITLVLLALLTIHSTILLIKCKNYLNKQIRRRRQQQQQQHGVIVDNSEDNEIITYGQVGKTVFGVPGDVLISLFLVFTQCGFCCAYLIFISENLADILHAPHYKPLFILITCVLLIPIGMVRSLKHLSPFSMLSEVCLILGLIIVVYFDLHQLVLASNTTGFPGPARNLHGFDWKNFPVFFGITIFGFEGIGLALPIQHNMKNRKSYSSLLVGALFLISSLMGIFGLLGYFAFGTGINSVITLNLPAKSPLSLMIKIAFMIALLFTHPIQLFPVSEMLDQNFRLLRRFVRGKMSNNSQQEGKINSSDEESVDEIDLPDVMDKNANNNGPTSRHSELRKKLMIKSGKLQFLNNCLSLRSHGENIIRIAVIVITGVLASAIPDFGNFLSLIGGFGGTMLAYVFPSLIHLKLLWHKTSWTTKLKDILIILFGLFASILTAVMSVRDIIHSIQKKD